MIAKLSRYFESVNIALKWLTAELTLPNLSRVWTVNRFINRSLMRSSLTCSTFCCTGLTFRDWLKKSSDYDQYEFDIFWFHWDICQRLYVKVLHSTYRQIVRIYSFIDILSGVIGMLVFNLVKLMQLTVLPDNWHHSMITSIRLKLFRTVAQVVSRGQQLWLAITASFEKVMMLIQTRDKIYALE